MRCPNCLTASLDPFCVASLPNSTSARPPSADSLTNFLSSTLRGIGSGVLSGLVAVPADRVSGKVGGVDGDCPPPPPPPPEDGGCAQRAVPNIHAVSRIFRIGSFLFL